MSRRNRPLLIALYANAAGLLLIGVALFSRSNTNRLPDFASNAFGQSQLPIGGGGGVFVVPAQYTPGNFGAYVMDVDAQTLCAYLYVPADKQLRLIAARSFRYDRHLGNYNTTPPPLEIRDLVEKEAAAVRSENKPVPEPEKKN